MRRLKAALVTGSLSVAMLAVAAPADAAYYQFRIPKPGTPCWYVLTLHAEVNYPSTPAYNVSGTSFGVVCP